MQILRAADHLVMAWKNGGGATTQAAVFPPGAGLDAFDWRISMADVTEDGPFSPFPGIDRSLAILEGNGLVLDIDGLGRRRLTRASTPLAFPADAPTQGTLIRGRVRDLNVMSRRGVFAHRLVRFATAEPVRLAPHDGATTLVLSRTAGLALTRDDVQVLLGLDDAAFIDAPTLLTPPGAAEFYLVELFPDG